MLVSCATVTAELGGCSRRAVEEVEVIVRQVALDPNSRSPVILLEDKGHTVALPIWVGPSEAQAIAMRLEGVESPRPLTHDLMKNMLDGVGIGLRKVVIGDLRDNTYYARIVLMQEGEEVEIDSRPSDAIALAVRFGQPIFVSTKLLQEANTIPLAGLDAPGTVTLAGVTVQPLSPELAGHFDLPPGNGVLVADVSDGAGGDLQRGDVILEVDGAAVHDPQEFRRLLTNHETVVLAVHRGGDRVEIEFAPAGG
jgi:bifunctional DNase/RNase